jgi:hypothetical protein
VMRPQVVPQFDFDLVLVVGAHPPFVRHGVSFLIA